jgi:hypothetical protein
MSKVREKGAKESAVLLFDLNCCIMISRLYGLAGMAELADARDLKSLGFYDPYRFDSGSRHHACVVSSGGEHYLDTVGVSSSNLLRRTIFMPNFRIIPRRYPR